jgi:D-galactose 1-dehydrogenase
MAKYRIGIIGFGKIAQDQHLPAIRANPDFELLAVSSTSGQTPSEATYFYTDYREMLAKTPNLDAVAICTPPGPRRTSAADCLAAGKHVLLEKPPAGTVTEVRDIADRAAAAGKVAFATWHAQHNEAVKRAKEALAGKTVKSLNVTWKEDLRRWHPGQDWIMAAGGFGIFDPGINALSILTRILPAPVFVTSAKLSFPSNREAPIAADLVFSTGLTEGEDLRAAFDWRQTGDQTWEIDAETSDGLVLKLSGGGSVLEIAGQPRFEGQHDEYPDIYRDFARLLAAGTSQVDAAPFQLVADCFMLGSRVEVDAFRF